MAISVVMAHGLLLVLAWRLGERLHRKPEGDDPSLTWILLHPPPSAARSATALQDQRRSVSDERRSQRTLQPSSATRAEPAATPPLQIDWGAHATFSARQTVEGSTGERYRNLGARKAGPPSEPDAPTLFEREPEIFGEVAEDTNGDPILRLSKHCYQELQKRLPTARDYVDPNKLLLRKCMFPIGKLEPRGDLFEHLKRDRPLPSTKAGASAELRLPQEK